MGPSHETSDYPADWSGRVRSLAFASVIALWLVGIALFLPLVSSALVALLIFYMLHFPIQVSVTKFGITYRTSAIIWFILFLFLSGVLLLTAVPSFLNALWEFGAAVRAIVDDIFTFLKDYTPDQGWVVNDEGKKEFNLNFILEPLSKVAQRETTPDEFVEMATYLGSRFLGVASAVGGFFFAALAVLALAYYLIVEMPLFLAWIANLPAADRREAAILLSRGVTHWNRYFYGILVLSLIGGGATLVLLLVMGIKDALMLSVLSTLIYLIPIFGGFIAPFVVALGALVGGSSWIELEPAGLAAVTWLLFVVIHGGIISGVVAPKVFGKAARFPVTIIIVGLVIFTMIGGLVGALLAVPAMGMIREAYHYLCRKMRGGDPYPGEPEPRWVQGYVTAPE